MFTISKERADADRRMIDAIRERFGMAPLYGPNGDRKTEAERFAVADHSLSDAWDHVHRHQPGEW